MTYAERLHATKPNYPFANWRDAFNDGLEQYTEKNVDAAQQILDELIDNLIKLGEGASEADKLKLFQDATLSFNELNEELDGELIETGEREDLCALIDEIGMAAGIDPSRYGAGDGIASEWREW